MTDWRHKAACRDEDPELFFVTGQEDAPENKSQIAKAKAVCHRCDVAAQCLQWSLDLGKQGEFGVWGALTESERRKLRRQPAPEPEVDDPMLARAIRGLPVVFTPEQRREAVVAMHKAGYTKNQIRLILRMSGSLVKRYVEEATCSPETA